MLDSIAEALLKPVNRAAIAILAVYTFLWGLWLALPWPTFIQGTSWDIMAALAPEWAWGGFAMIIGVVMLLGIVKALDTPLIRSCLTGYFFWMVISIFFLLGSWESTGWITAGMISVYCGFLAINLRVNRKILRFKPKGDIL